MKIIKTNTLNSRELSEVKALEALCKAYDSLSGSLFLSSELNTCESLPCFFLMYEKRQLLGFLSIFMPSEDEAQISVCVHPDSRRQGLCTRLLREAADLLEEYDIYDMLFLTEPGNAAFMSLLKKLKAELINSEYLMTYDNTNADIETANIQDNLSIVRNNFELITTGIESLDTLISIHHRAFDTAYAESEAFVSALLADEYIKAFAYQNKITKSIAGSCYLDISGSTLIILGVCIDPELQNKGLGQSMLIELINKALFFKRPIALQVSGSNAARHLYEKLGFKVTSQFDYHIAACENI